MASKKNVRRLFEVLQIRTKLDQMRQNGLQGAEEDAPTEMLEIAVAEMRQKTETWAEETFEFLVSSYAKQLNNKDCELAIQLLSSPVFLAVLNLSDDVIEQGVLLWEHIVDNLAEEQVGIRASEGTRKSEYLH